MSDPVVVGVDGTGRSLRALTWGAHEARLRGADLLVVHALPRYEADFPFFPPGRFEEAEARGQEIVAEAVALVRETHPDVAVVTEQPMQTPAQALLERSGRAQVVALGAKGEDVGNLLLGSTVLQVVGHADCPVVVVGHASAGHDRVAVGTDGSPDSGAALALAFEEDRLRGARLSVVSALGLPQGWPRHLLRPLPPDDEEALRRRESVEAQLTALLEEHPDTEVSLDVHHAEPLTALGEASHRADLLVLGSRGRGGFHGLAVGSTTHRMLHLAGCPVAVTRSRSAST
ncbi:nucleotide-binding universal stress UspA family protein [Nocardioides salarius]|uniref:Nucleotide-binding universal stress UspA family protein n=1 Tax=Nocardioides salarius TaxID=374513 RepID=A0ABS2M617_9ACTN|nr:universal stress protein [Nocardioides salarius]MBM7506634.1 nucleotide-binding universal stress UspA family protein [Nocardioides salarius]